MDSKSGSSLGYVPPWWCKD